MLALSLGLGESVVIGDAAGPVVVSRGLVENGRVAVVVAVPGQVPYRLDLADGDEAPLTPDAHLKAVSVGAGDCTFGFVADRSVPVWRLEVLLGIALPQIRASRPRGPRR